MDEKKNKKKTLTISTTLTKKIDISTLAKDGKKAFSIEKKKQFKNPKDIGKAKSSFSPSKRIDTNNNQQKGL